MNKKIVISRYNEDISWINNYSYDYIVYNKGEKIEEVHNVLNVENIGNNQRDIFQFIVENYDNLPNIIVFVQGNPYDHCKKEKFDKLILSEQFTSLESYEDIIQSNAQTLDKYGGFMEINNSWYINHYNNTLGQTCAWTSFNHFMDSCFVNYVSNHWNRFAPGSQYIITKEIAHHYPKNFWKFLMNVLNKNHMTEGHVIERSLWMIFQCYLILRNELK